MNAKELWNKLLQVEEQHDHDLSDADVFVRVIQPLLDALEFYADPETYFAIAFLSDPPCGDFAEDFEEIVDPSFGIPSTKPGKRARKVLLALENLG